MVKCKVATIQEMEQKWNYEIQNHPNDNRWIIWKETAINNAKNGNRVCFHALLDGEIIAECTAIVSKEDTGLENKEFVDDTSFYLEAFRVVKKYEGQGYFSKLYRFMEEFLIKRGAKRLILGVEPTETRNMQIYIHYGFTNFLCTKKETYPPRTEGESPEEITVNYYSKEIWIYQ